MFKSIVLLAFISQQVAGHGYLYAPRSRNWYAVEMGVEGQSQAGVPGKEYCPDCLNTNEAGGICGKKSGGTSYTDYRDSQRNLMPWISQGTFTAGEIIDVKHLYTTHHYGHIQLSACSSGDNSNQDCFDNPANFLHFVSDELDGFPADPNYPERGYTKRKDVPATYEMKFKLPDTVYGDNVMIQWRYITANGCLPDGYISYFQQHVGQGTVISADWKGANLGACTAYPQDGSKPAGAPEQFWNCAEVTIEPAFPTVSPKPSVTPTPTQSPTVKPEPVTYPPNPNGISFPCCSWGGASCAQPDNDFCHVSKTNCEGSCTGTFLDPDESTPTSPWPTIGTPAPFAQGDIPTTGIPCCSDNFKRCIDWCDACNQDQATCLLNSYYWIPWGAPIDPDSCIAITYSCVGHPGQPCCPGMICNPENETAHPCIPDPDVSAPVAPPIYQEPIVAPVAAPVAVPVAAPLAAPIAAPVSPPAAPPVSQPVPQPVPQPIAQPVAPPVGAPPPIVAPVTSRETSNGIPLPCCGWAGEGCSKPEDDYCQGNSDQCTGNCNGIWHTSNTSPVPVAPPPPSGGLSCCTWGGWSVCPDWTQGGNDSCQNSSQGCSSCNGQWIDDSSNRSLRRNQA